MLLLLFLLRLPPEPKDSEDVDVSRLSRQILGSQAVLLCQVGVGIVCQKQRDDVGVTVCSSKVQRCRSGCSYADSCFRSIGVVLSRQACGVYVCPCVDEHLDDHLATRGGCDVYWQHAVEDAVDWLSVHERILDEACGFVPCHRERNRRTNV